MSDIASSVTLIGLSKIKVSHVDQTSTASNVLNHDLNVHDFFLGGVIFQFHDEGANIWVLSGIITDVSIAQDTVFNVILDHGIQEFKVIFFIVSHVNHHACFACKAVLISTLSVQLKTETHVEESLTVQLAKVNCCVGENHTSFTQGVSSADHDEIDQEDENTSHQFVDTSSTLLSVYQIWHCQIDDTQIIHQSGLAKTDCIVNIATTIADDICFFSDDFFVREFFIFVFVSEYFFIFY